jgi:branched-chain amino acid transport system permease protein
MEYEISLLTTMGVSVLFALSLNLITGFCGQISLGHAAFLGIGAYVAAMLGKAGLPFLATIPLAMLLAGAVGVLVGLASLRVRADFLAITTMGVGFLFVGILRQQKWKGGELGISGIPDTGMSKTGFMLFTLLRRSDVVRAGRQHISANRSRRTSMSLAFGAAWAIWSSS